MSLGGRAWGYPKISDALVPNLERWTWEGWLGMWCELGNPAPLRHVVS